jgi:hypothetical protein
MHVHLRLFWNPTLHRDPRHEACLGACSERFGTSIRISTTPQCFLTNVEDLFGRTKLIYHLPPITPRYL